MSDHPFFCFIVSCLDFFKIEICEISSSKKLGMIEIEAIFKLEMEDCFEK
jgi:hypothetical protein